MDQKLVLAIDQGTSSSRAIIFTLDGQPLAKAQVAVASSQPRAGWVEQDPEEIWSSVRQVVGDVVAQNPDLAARIGAVGLANQRETTVLWERRSGRPLTPAIVWQCRRSADIIARWEDLGWAEEIGRRTGLVLDPYFSASKVVWLLEQDAALRRRAEQGEVCFGTVDSFLCQRLTGQHLTDSSNASRTMLFNLDSGEWDQELLARFNIPGRMLPEIRASVADFGRIAPQWFGHQWPLTAMAGDQHASLFGHGCNRPGEAKATYGTGCFLLMQCGDGRPHSAHGLISTVGTDTPEGRSYALEGSVFMAGSVVQWLRDQLAIIEDPAQSQALAESIDDTDGVFLVPAFTGLGAPYWDAAARGILVGVTQKTGRAQVVRAALEAIAHQCADVVEAMAADAGRPLERLRVDGGLTVNGFLMQYQADLLGTPVEVAAVSETTARGAALLAGWGVAASPAQMSAPAQAVYQPRRDRLWREAQRRGWRRAVERARGWQE